jgi:hypothetical protein
VREAVGADDADGYERAFELIRLAGLLGLDADIERAQELVYDALRREGARRDPELGELALKLNLSPKIFDELDARAATDSNLREPALP